jgi:signal transduction histidine kinase
MHIPHHHLVGFTLKETSELFPFDQMADELLQNVGDLDVITKVIETEEDRPIYVRASINRIPGEPGETLGLVIVLQDITYFKELEQKKSEFVSMVTHELRAPLGTVDTQLNVVLTGLAGGVTEKQKDLLGRIKSRIGGVLELINNLLDLSKIEARQFVQQKKAMDINPIVQEVINMMEAQAQEKGVTITVQLAADLPQVMMDPLSMSEVITNLLSNAIRYTPTRGHIEVQTGIEANYVQLSVTDTGIGIEAEYLDKIFDRFFRVKNEKTRKIVGTGLGLSIVKAIVDDHLGFVRVRSQQSYMNEGEFGIASQSMIYKLLNGKNIDTGSQLSFEERNFIQKMFIYEFLGIEAEDFKRRWRKVGNPVWQGEGSLKAPSPAMQILLDLEQRIHLGANFHEEAGRSE